MGKNKPPEWPKPTFVIGDQTDQALCIGIKHEFLRCDDAFQEFAAAGRAMIMSGSDRRIAYKAYAAYARFVHHLYEFYLACAARDFRNTKQLPAELAECVIAGQTQRILRNRREAILDRTAPSWENHISYYPENVPATFARDFRSMRNILSGHVSTKRATVSLTNFYNDNHKFLFMLYFEARSWWGRQREEFPDLGEITSFSVAVQRSPPVKDEVSRPVPPACAPAH
jgi:hypothetical protein